MHKWLCLGIALGVSSMQSFALSKAEIVVSAFDGIHCVDSDGNLKWSFSYSGRVSGAAIGNIDNAGYPEVLVGADKLYCFEHDGNLKWSYPISTNSSSPAIANVDTAGHPEVLVVSQSLALYCFNSDGTVRWSYQMSGAGFYSAVTAANADGVGMPEILAATDSWLYCMRSNGTVDWSYGISGAQCPGIAVADIDLNGSPEIVVSSNAYIYCLEGDGSEKWVHSAEPEISQAAIADINNDGKPEIVVHSFSSTTELRKITAFQENTAGTGLNTIWVARCQDRSSSSAEAPVICDIDGDGDKDVLWIGNTAGSASSLEGLLYVLNGTDGKHPDNTGAPFFTDSHFADGTLYERGVAVADIDADGHVEVVGIKCGGGVSARAGISVLECDAWAAGRNVFSSHLYHITDVNDDMTIPAVEPNNWEDHNTWLTQLTTGGSGFGTPTLKWTYSDPALDWICSSIAIAPIYEPTGVEEKDSSPESFLLGILYRNSSRAVALSLLEGNEVSLRILDIAGRERKVLNIGRMAAGTHEIPLGLADFESGIYFVQARVGNRTLTCKVVALQ